MSTPFGVWVLGYRAKHHQWLVEKSTCQTRQQFNKYTNKILVIETVLCSTAKQFTPVADSWLKLCKQQNGDFQLSTIYLPGCLMPPIWNPGCSHLSWPVMDRNAIASPYVIWRWSHAPLPSLTPFSHTTTSDAGLGYWGIERGQKRGTWGARLRSHRPPALACRRPTVNIALHLSPFTPLGSKRTS